MNRVDLTLAAFAGISGFQLPGVKPARNVCKTCGEKIPPGKPGRRCKGCRSAEPVKPNFITIQEN
jgi:hypothetical protein